MTISESPKQMLNECLNDIIRITETTESPLPYKLSVAISQLADLRHDLFLEEHGNKKILMDICSDI